MIIELSTSLWSQWAVVNSYLKILKMYVAIFVIILFNFTLSLFLYKLSNHTAFVNL